MKAITLSQGYAALVDDEDFEALSRFKWSVHIQLKPSGGKSIYATRTVTENGRKVMILMHREILGTDGQVDHWDTDGLNNQRHNLRPATQSQNNANRRKLGGTTSIYKGVYWHGPSSKWLTQITKDGKKKSIGYFTDEVDAATAYNFAALEAFGEFARMNVPMEVQ